MSHLKSNIKVFQYRAGIHVYILDSGIQEDHPDFDDRAQLDANFINYETAEDYSGHGKHSN